MTAGSLRALLAVVVLQGRQALQPGELFLTTVTNVPLAAMAAWIATRSADPAKFTHVAFGVILLAVWNSGLFRVGAALEAERIEQTLDLSLTSRTPLLTILLGKACALTLPAACSGVASFLAVVVVGQRLPVVEHPLVFAASFALAWASVLITAFLFTPLLALTRGGAGVFGTVAAFGLVFNGFLYPASALPPAVAWVARLLPAPWAMDAALAAASPAGDPALIAPGWLAALTLCAAYLAATAWLFTLVERRLRVTGSLAAG